MGDSVLAPGGFHARVYDGAGRVCEDEGGV